MIIELEAVVLAEIARFADAQNDGPQVAIEAAEHVLRRDLGEVPRSDSTLHGLEGGVLADALCSAEHQRVVNFLGRSLPTMCEPLEDMLGAVAEHAVQVVEPRPGFVRIAQHNVRRAVEVEARHAWVFDPATLCKEPVLDQQRLARRPGHLLDRLVLIEPGGR